MITLKPTKAQIFIEMLGAFIFAVFLMALLPNWACDAGENACLPKRLLIVGLGCQPPVFLWTSLFMRRVLLLDDAARTMTRQTLLGQKPERLYVDDMTGYRRIRTPKGTGFWYFIKLGSGQQVKLPPFNKVQNKQIVDFLEKFGIQKED